uniref:Uncharacterized protein n=1 Tax=Anguilla anguilla TaxID=7936 RepID=A0A0E9WFY0_ANGAN
MLLRINTSSYKKGSHYYSYCNNLVIVSGPQHGRPATDPNN